MILNAFTFIFGHFIKLGGFHWSAISLGCELMALKYAHTYMKVFYTHILINKSVEPNQWETLCHHVPNHLLIASINTWSTQLVLAKALEQLLHSHQPENEISYRHILTSSTDTTLLSTRVSMEICPADRITMLIFKVYPFMRLNTWIN